MKKQVVLLFLFINSFLIARADYSKYGKPGDFNDSNSGEGIGILFLVAFVVLLIVGMIRSKNKK